MKIDPMNFFGRFGEENTTPDPLGDLYNHGFPCQVSKFWDPWSSKTPAISRFAPLQFAFCSELRPGLVTPELLASIIDKIAAAASVTGWTLHDSGVRFLFGWILLGFYRASYCIQICIFVSQQCARTYLWLQYCYRVFFCGHPSSCLVSFDFCLKNMIRPVSHDRSTTKKGPSDATMPQLGSTARLLKYVLY